MPTLQENLQSRRETIAARLASLPESADKPTLSVDGQSLDWSGTKQALIDELRQLDEMIAQAGGPWEIES
jgi:hypothetical protein